MQPELVSIMMPAYNAERFIARAIDSAIQQTYPHWELLVVNDGSTDDTEEILAGYHDARLRFFYQPNGGEAAARNLALDHVRGKYVSFLDADDEYMPDHLEQAVAYLDAHPEIDGVYSDGYYIDQNGSRIKPLSARRRGSIEGDIFEAMVRSSGVFGTPLCVVLRREVISRLNLYFDPQITIGPDWDFLTAYSQAARFGQIPNQTCLYRIHHTNVSLQTNHQKRLLSLAHCREKAIRMPRFGECSLETREFVFYDLLVNLLRGSPSRQAEITTWAEFSALPSASRARLYRLMASGALADGGSHPEVGGWLQQASRLAPTSLRARVLDGAYRIHPALCRSLVQHKHAQQADLPALRPFADLIEG